MNGPGYKTKEDRGAAGKLNYGEGISSLSAAERARWVIALLTNDDVSSDEELVRHIMEEGGFNRQDAESWVRKRDQYMGKI